MEWEHNGFSISDDPSRLDLGFIVESLQQTYWAAGRPAETIIQSIQNSLCFGLYELDQQIGFARVVTDESTISWICDVFIAAEYRGRGLGTWLVRCVTEHPMVKPTTQLLGTRDAHGLYEKFGFVRREMMISWPTTRRR
jgi:GNAT superfamily N-acetyltransferase